MPAGFQTLDDFDPRGKRILVRVDLNVPLENNQVTDTTRIRRVAGTINELADKGGKVILLAHFGRPKGEVVPEMSLAKIVSKASEVFGKPVAFSTDCIGPMAEAAVGQMSEGDILLLENTRFHAGEEMNDKAFAEALASNGDAYVNDAFSAAHRAHASTEGVAHILPSYAGRTMQEELEALESGLGNPEKPVAAIVGGAKVSTKLELLKNLVSKVDTLIIGGGMANTFLFAQGRDVGKSLCENSLSKTASEILEHAKDQNCEILLPEDAVVAEEFKANANNKTVEMGEGIANQMILDAGPESIATFKKAVASSKTLIWNGPLGAFEMTPFDRATVELARHAAQLTKQGKLVSVGGGGDTVSALNHAGVADDFSYVSTAGGAFLEWMEGKELPGVQILKR